MRISPAAAAGLLALARAPALREACGILLGRARDGRLFVESARRVPNVARGAMLRFRMRAAAIARAAAAAEGLDLLGYFHTHVVGSNRASPDDVRTMRAVAGLHVIVDRAGRARLYLSDGRRILAPAVRRLGA